MIDPNNIVSLSCGVVAEPEVINDNIVKFRIAVDYAGNEKGSGNTSGYFDMTYFMNNDDNKRNAGFVRSQIADGKMTKGSQLRVVGRLTQERWSTDDKKNSRVVVIAESISYASGGQRKTEDGDTTTTTPPAAKSVSAPEF